MIILVPELCMTNYDLFLDSLSRKISPQADGDGCATLGWLYLKELLKNNLDQLNNFSLIIPVYTNAHQDKPLYLFVPSPQVLRYSQSELYNKVICALFDVTTNSVDVRHRGKHIEVKTLKNIIEESLRLSNLKEDNNSIQKLESALTQLANLSIRWLDEYQKAAGKRQEMEFHDTNYYLSYNSQKLEEKANNSMTM